MTATSYRRRVMYVLSSSLIKASNPLPSNEGRSTLVHSLAYHLGLLDLESSDWENEDEKTDLLTLLAAPSSPACLADSPARANVIPPKRATARQLRSYHTPAFVDELLRERGIADSSEGSTDAEYLSTRPSKKRRKTSHLSKKPPPGQTEDAFGLSYDNPPFPELADHVCLVAGASITAAEELAEGRTDVAIAWDGGRHHAKKGLASGFCYVNDAVLAILALRKPRRVPEKEADSSLSTASVVKSSAEVGEALPLGFGAQLGQVRQAANAKAGETSAPRSKPAPTEFCRPERILYLDLDLHWGDGVEDAFFNTGSVMTLSVHMFAPGFFPCGASRRGSPPRVTSRYEVREESGEEGVHIERSQGTSETQRGPPGSLHGPTGPASVDGKPNLVSLSALSVPLRPGASGATILRIFESCIQPIALAYDPEYIVLQCGADALSGDPTATYNYDLGTFVQLVSRVLDWDRPTLLLGGGGYDSPNAARCWSAVLACALRRWRTEGSESREDDLSCETPIPDHAEWPLYAPSCTLDVRPGQMKDTNNDEYLEEVEAVCAGRAELIRSLVQS